MIMIFIGIGSSVLWVRMPDPTPASRASSLRRAQKLRPAGKASPLELLAMSVSVLLVDDHILFRQALRLLLGARPGIEVVAELGDGTQVQELVSSLAPDVVVMDISMPDVNGVEATRALLARNPKQRVLVLSAYSSAAFVSELLQIGALGYVLKTSSSECLVEAILAVADGHRYLCPTISALLDTPGAKAGRARSGKRVSRELSAREKQVLRLLAAGKSSPQIADVLQIAPSTVDVHRRNIMSKLELHSVAELTHYAIRTGVIGI